MGFKCELLIICPVNRTEKLLALKAHSDRQAGRETG